MNHIHWPQEQPQRDLVGGKAAALAALQNNNIAIPPWFALSTNDSSETLSQAEIAAALKTIAPNGEPVAVRSSAIDEDSSEHSFAGQFATFLNVPHAEVIEKIAAVRQSACSQHVAHYRSERTAIDQPHSIPSVLIQRMVQPDCAGVAFSMDPVSGRRGVAVVAAVRGLGEALVSGESNADTYHVDRDNAVTLIATADQTAILRDDQAQAIAALARQTARHFGRPQDIEWAIENDQLYLLQSRPITGISNQIDPDGVANLWDNSNIAESYPGHTTPLTFSFVRFAYGEVYRQFCRMMGVTETVLDQNTSVFRCMLGYINGRIYYNLLNWYRLLALLPGYATNRGFMEEMMGVGEPLPAHFVEEELPKTFLEKTTDLLRICKCLSGLAKNYVLLPRQTRRFYTHLHNVLGSDHPDLGQYRPDELITHYRQLEAELLTRWDAPLINDFFAMIFYGILGKLCNSWCTDSEQDAAILQNSLLCDIGDVISTEPAERIMQMATIARQNPALVGALCNGSHTEIMAQASQTPDFLPAYQSYITRFGDRCLEELKLESISLHEDPMNLLRSVGRVAASGQVGKLQVAGGQVAGGQSAHIAEAELVQSGAQDNGRSRSGQTLTEPSLRSQAESTAKQALHSHPIRRLIFNWVLRRTRTLVQNRENLRFERTRLFGRVRMIFLAMGNQLAQRNLLDNPRDIFFLEVDEIFRFAEGSATCTNLRGLAALRKAEFDGYRTTPPPADRFETRGMVYAGNTFEGNPPEIRHLEDGEQQQGIGSSPGIARGRARVIEDPHGVVVEPDEILIVKRTDPGWIVLLVAAAGLVVEHGSLLSHAAIVSRELGLPSVVSLPGCTEWINDGDWVELDGSTGIVTKVA